jgi:hypothetical protein
MPRKKPDTISLSIWAYTILAVIISVLVQVWMERFGLVSKENGDLVGGILLLAILLMFLTADKLITGEEPRIGKTRYTLPQVALMIILLGLFGFLGFIAGGNFGLLVGMLIGAGISMAIRYIRKRTGEH